MKNLLSLSIFISLFTGISFTADFDKAVTESVDPKILLTARYSGDWRRRPLIKNLMRAPIIDKEQRLATFKLLTQKVSKPKDALVKSEKVDVEMPNPPHFFLSSRDHRFVFKVENVESVQPDNICLACCKPASPVPIRSRARSLSINKVDPELASFTTASGSELSQEGRLITSPEYIRTPLIGHQPKTLFDLVAEPSPNEDAIKAQLQNKQSSKVLRHGFLHIVFARGNISPALFSLMNERRNSLESLDFDDE
jgi:hypothetical protein